MEIRLATPDDASDITAVLSATFEPLRDRYTVGTYNATVVPPEEVLDRLGEGPVWLAVIDARPVGTVSLKIDGSTAYLRGMGVVPSARGKGAGAGLMDAVDAYVADHGFERVWLRTTEFLHDARRLYRRRGFEEVPGEDHYFGTPVITMERRN